MYTKNNRYIIFATKDFQSTLLSIFSLGDLIMKIAWLQLQEADPIAMAKTGACE